MMPNGDRKGCNFLHAPNTPVLLLFLHTFQFPMFILKELFINILTLNVGHFEI